VLSYNSLLFLKKHGFSLDQAFSRGVPYLSRSEFQLLIGDYILKDMANLQQPIDLAKQDRQTQDFYNHVRAEIQYWESHPDEVCHQLLQSASYVSDKLIMSKSDFLNIGNPDGRLNRLQQRLVHQLLKTEFQGRFRAYMKQSYFMQIVRDEPSEKEYEVCHIVL